MGVAAAADLMFRSPVELAALVRSGDVTSRELVEASLERIEALEPQVNAFTTLDADRALASADAIGPGDERPFAGVPLAIKDLFAAEGLRLTFCSDLWGDHVPDHDDYVIRRLKDAGFVIVGTTNSPEFGILPTTEPRRFGPTHNPWDLGRTPGGSSGGAAAAVASGMVPIAQGSDGGGSIRIPAACCGLFGLKPARGRISRGPSMGDHIITEVGVLTRTVSDTAAALDVMAGYEIGDATWAPPPEAPFSDLAALPPAGLRIAMTTKPPIEAAVAPECAGAVEEAAGLLSELGHHVEESEPPWGDDALLLALFSAVFATADSWDAVLGSRVRGREVTEDDVEPLSWELYRQSTTMSAVEYLDARNRLQEMARGLIAWSIGYDAVLTPALAEPPVPLGTIDPCGEVPLEAFARSGRFTPFTAVANVTGLPAVSVPVFQSEDGLPLAVQLFGRPAGEGDLLALAAQLEAARPWAERRPPIAA